MGEGTVALNSVARNPPETLQSVLPLFPVPTTARWSSPFSLSLFCMRALPGPAQISLHRPLQLPSHPRHCFSP